MLIRTFGITRWTFEWNTVITTLMVALAGEDRFVPNLQQMLKQESEKERLSV